MFSCLQILEAFLWFVLINLLIVTLIILTLSLSRLLILLLRLVVFIFFLNSLCLVFFFMFYTYNPSECQADYFIFERIESLKPAIEACGISTLSQSPMLGFHKQMDNRIKLLEEILSFRMQGVEFDNGDMYVDGHKAAS